MAKEFKEFDKKFAKLAGTALKTIESIKGRVPKEDIQDIEGWPYIERFTEDYSQSFIAYAVYTAPTALFWQQCRVSLKGLSTKEKLYCLTWWWDVHVVDEKMHSNAERRMWIVCINNYIGALKRGGQLDLNLKVQK